MQYFLVMDAGTTSIKAGLISLDGKFADIQNEPAQVLMPFSGASEMDMNDVWEVAKKVILKLRANNEAIWPEVVALGISAQGDGLWAIDAHGKPVRNAMLWNDTRTVLDYDAEHHVAVPRREHRGADLAEEERAGELCEDRLDLPLQRLAELQADRADRHRRVRRLHGADEHLHEAVR